MKTQQITPFAMQWRGLNGKASLLTEHDGNVYVLCAIEYHDRTVNHWLFSGDIDRK